MPPSRYSSDSIGPQGQTPSPAAAPVPVSTETVRTLSNALQPDGRINAGVNALGKEISHTVPPQSDRFWDNIEPAIRPLVRALREKRYLTYGSCDGHTLWNRRFVGIAFYDEASREALLAPIEAAQLPIVSIERLHSAANMQLGSHGHGEDWISHEETAHELNPEVELESFNLLFGRNYDRICFAEISLGRRLREGWWHKPDQLHEVWTKWRRWDALTRRIADIVAGEAVPRYRL